MHTKETPVSTHVKDTGRLQQPAGIEPMAADTIQGCARAMFPIRNIVPMVHGAVGCAFYPRFFLSFSDSIHWRMLGTLFEAGDVIFGGGKTLETALERAIDVYRPELVVVNHSVVPMLIGDDVHGISKMVSEKTGVKIISVENPNYAGNEIDGYLNVVEEYVKQLMEKKGQTRKRMVNLIGTMPGEHNWKRDVRELKRLLEALGLTVHAVILGPGVEVAEIANAPQAEANVMLFPEIGLPIARLMQERFDMPYIDTTLPPIGVEATKEWLTRIAEFFGLEARAKALIDAELNAMGEALGELNAGDCYNMNWMFTKTYAMESMPFWVAGMVKMLYEDLGLLPHLLAFQCFHPYSYEQLQNILQQYPSLKPEVQTEGDYYQWRTALVRDHNYPWGDPWFVFGSTHTAVDLALLGERIPVFYWSSMAWDRKIITERPFVGFRGVVTIAEEAHNILEQKAWLTRHGLPNWAVHFEV